jgi:FkbM family methyltransferase
MRKLLKSLLSPGILYMYRAHRAYWFGECELQFLKELVPADRVAIDVGANYGEYTYWLEKLSYKVALFEPHPECVEHLKQCVSPSTDIYQMGLSNRSDESVLRIPIDGNSSAVICRASLSNKAVSEFDLLDELSIKLARLDDLNINDVGFIKIDVEGHEREVIEGAEKTIRNFKPNLQVEIEQRHLDCPIQEIFGYIESLGYDSYFYRGKKLTKLVEFDLKRDQIDMLAKSSFSVSLLNEGYVNNFIFLAKKCDVVT